MPPKKKKARKSATHSTPPVQQQQQQLEPLEHISRAREQEGSRLKSRKKNVNYDIEQNIREIRAILATNSEIFERCMVFMKDADGKKTYVPDQAKFKFERISFDVVKTVPLESTTRFITFPALSTVAFSLKHLTKLPADLDGIIVAKHMDKPYSMFIDYPSFFEKSLLLDDEILEPFLASLKEHLMNIQVCLGGIENWAMEPKSIANFLEETFGVTVKIPKVLSQPVSCSCPQGTHSSNDLCLSCGYNYLTHKSSGNASDRRCPFSTNKSGTFQCRRYHILKDLRSSGRYEVTFAIAKEKEQQKLKKFLDFLKFSSDGSIIL